nr:hypothetical protein [Pandoravirus aubagnensis]
MRKKKEVLVTLFFFFSLLSPKKNKEMRTHTEIFGVRRSCAEPLFPFVFLFVYLPTWVIDLATLFCRCCYCLRPPSVSWLIATGASLLFLSGYVLSGKMHVYFFSRKYLSLSFQTRVFLHGKESKKGAQIRQSAVPRFFPLSQVFCQSLVCLLSAMCTHKQNAFGKEKKALEERPMPLSARDTRRPPTETSAKKNNNNNNNSTSSSDRVRPKEERTNFYFIFCAN